MIEWEFHSWLKLRNCRCGCCTATDCYSYVKQCSRVYLLETNRLDMALNLTPTLTLSFYTSLGSSLCLLLQLNFDCTSCQPFKAVMQYDVVWRIRVCANVINLLRITSTRSANENGLQKCFRYAYRCMCILWRTRKSAIHLNINLCAISFSLNQ